MSAPDTNIETQKKRHRGPLSGIALGLTFAGLLFAGLLIWTAYAADRATATSPAEAVATDQ